MSRSSNQLREILGGLIALAGAFLVTWQAVLIYYLIIGRVTVGEEHPPFTVVAIFILIGAFLIGAGYKISKPS